MRTTIFVLGGFMLLAGFPGCRGHQYIPPPFKALHADQTVAGTSSFPPALHPKKVGEYPAATKSGAGYFFDEVLEYRVWLCPAKGAQSLAGDNDYFFAFASYENALAFSRKTKGAEEPLVLIRQYEWIDEPSPGKYEVQKEERLTEWRVAWLKDSKRGPTSISEFLVKPRKSRHRKEDGGER
jgi:hypothetical protein